MIKGHSFKIKIFKKSQFELLPVIISLIFFFFLLIFGLVVYFNYWKDKIEKHNKYIRKIGYISLGEQIVSLPVLNCGKLEQIYGCLDLYKIKYFKNLLNDYYYNKSFQALVFKYGQKKVVIKIVFNKESNIVCSDYDLDNLESSDLISCGYYVLYNQTRNDFAVFSQKDVITFPILVRYKVEGSEIDFKYRVALLKIISYY